MESVLKYFQRYPFEESWEEISYEKALNSLLTTYKDNDMTHDLLTIPNRIEYRFGTIEVKEFFPNGSCRILMPGLCNMLPEDAEYTDSGKRRKRRRKT